MAAQFPPSMDGDLVWDGANLQEAAYTYQLTSVEVHEIESALAVFKGTSTQGFFTLGLVRATLNNWC